MASAPEKSSVPPTPGRRGNAASAGSSPSPGQPYGSIAISGLGLIGGSLALGLRRAGYRGRLIGISRRETIDEALRAGAIDAGHGYEELAQAAADADLVALAGPIAVIIEQLRTLGSAGALRAGTVITDVGSTKRAILEAARASLPREVFFIGGHPLAGSESRGFPAADPFLFQNAYYVLSPAPGTPAEEVARLGSLVGSLGARAVVLPAAEHDRIAAAISHLPQLLAVSLVRFLDELGPNREHAIHLAAGGFRDMTRIASSPYGVWRDIIATNQDAIGNALDRFLAHVRRVAGGLEPGALEDAFAGAARTRAEIPRDTKGFLHRLWDVLVMVEDRPGALVAIAAPLAAKGINIKDLELLKVREGEGGTFRLAFQSLDEARAAIAELKAQGHQARLRE